MTKKVFENEETLNKVLVHILKEIRTNMELSQSDLENKLNLGKEYISKIERGKTKVTVGLLWKFTTVFNISISEILQRAENHYGISK